MRFGQTRAGAIATAFLILMAIHNVAVRPASAGGVYTISGHHHIPTPPSTPTKPPVVNVQSYGATGNGTTDDTNAIQNAANAASNAQEGLFFPPGTYLHNSTVTFNGITVTGAGGASVLQAGSNTASAVILSGLNPSIQQLVISTQGLSVKPSPNQPNAATVLVVNASSFMVANDTIVQGPGHYGVYVRLSTVGNVSAVFFDGTGTSGDIGILVDACQNVSAVGNVFQNEDTGVKVTSSVGQSQRIAVQSNMIGNVTYPTLTAGVWIDTVNIVSVTNNVIQMNNANDAFNNPIYVNQGSSFYVSSNQTYGGWLGVRVVNPGSGGNAVSQNTIRNCGSNGEFISLTTASTVQLLNNTFGECGLGDTSSTSAIIFASGSSATLAGVQVLNNSYQGHTNFLQYLVYGPGLAAMNVSGNTQSQTTLPGNPNN